MNILWITTDRNGCGTYRAHVPALSLEEKGHHNLFLFPENLTFSDPHKELDNIDVVIFQRVLEPKIEKWLSVAKEYGVKTVFEMDDDLFHVPRHNPSFHFFDLTPIRRILKRHLTESDYIIASTAPLREEILRQTGRSPKEVFLCSNHLHPSIWSLWNFSAVEKLKSDKIVIGWQGSFTHDTDFKMALPALKSLMKKHSNVVVRLFGGVPFSIRGVLEGHQFEWREFVPFEYYPVTLFRLNFDIGLAPITDSKFNRSKSNIKWLEYSALQIPCVASNVFPYAKSISHGKTGFLATSQTEWEQCLEELIIDEAKRKSIAQAAFSVAWNKYGPTTSSAWEKVLDACLQ